MMFRLAVVGDLSLQDSARLKTVMDAALANADYVVQLGDMHPGYSVVKSAIATGNCSAIPGNHDTDWDAQSMGAHNWRIDRAECTLIGLDNSADRLDAGIWSSTLTVVNNTKPLFVFAHKPLSTIVLGDGSLSQHAMGEGVPNADAEKLKTWLATEKDSLIVHGHFHGWTYQKTWYSDFLVDGRGGAAPQLGYTVFYIQPEGWAFHNVIL